jgi:hypothetical protein
MFAANLKSNSRFEKSIQPPSPIRFTIKTVRGSNNACWIKKDHRQGGDGLALHSKQPGNLFPY